MYCCKNIVIGIITKDWFLSTKGMAVPCGIETNPGSIECSGNSWNLCAVRGYLNMQHETLVTNITPCHGLLFLISFMRTGNQGTVLNTTCFMGVDFLGPCMPCVDTSKCNTKLKKTNEKYNDCMHGFKVQVYIPLGVGFMVCKP